MLLSTIKENLILTLPILLTRLLGITSNLIAMILIAKLGTDALSASALMMGIFSVCVLLVMAFSFSVCAIISEACGSNNNIRVGKILFSSIFLNSLLAIPFMCFFYYISPILVFLHQPPHVSYLVGLYFHGMMIGYLPLLWANVIEQFFVGIKHPRYILYLSTISLFIMPLLTHLLMFGSDAYPALGMYGAGLAVSMMSFISFFYLLAVVIFKRWHVKYHLFGLWTKLDVVLMKKLYQLGWPIALQFSGEFLAYIFITIMMGWLGVAALAAQQVILQFTTVIVMIPASVSQATAVIVGQVRAKHTEKLISYHVNVSLIIVSFLMGMVALLYLSIPEHLINIYLENNNANNAQILTLASALLAITAFSQCFDGVKNVLAGAFRGLQETKIPMMIGMLTLWVISIPLAYYFGFILHQGAIGVRLGFTIGIACGAILLWVCWYAKMNNGTIFILPAMVKRVFYF
jgi:MATE family multidrug resistance protein